MILKAYVFPKLKTVKTWLDKSLKSSVSEHPSTVNMSKHPNQLSNLHDSTFIFFFITLSRTDLEDISVSKILTFRTLY